MRRPLPTTEGTGGTPVVVVPDKPEVNEPDSACDANSPRRTISAAWIPSQTTLPKYSETDECTPIKTSYTCSIVTVCAVGGTQTPVTSDAPDSSCVAFLGEGVPPPVIVNPS